MELSGVVLGVVGGLIIQLLTVLLAEHRERLKNKLATRDKQVENACATALILYREEELLIRRLATAEGKAAPTIKRDIRQQVQGLATTSRMMPPSGIRKIYMGLTGVQPSADLNEVRPLEGLEVKDE